MENGALSRGIVYKGFNTQRDLFSSLHTGRLYREYCMMPTEYSVVSRRGYP